MLLSYSAHQTFLIIFAGVSLIGNGLLIALILYWKSGVPLGRYRWLLLAFAVMDITISAYHAAVVPYGCLAFTWAAISQPPFIGFILNSIYCVLFYEPFILLMFHFIYRLRMINHHFCMNKHPWLFALFAVATNLVLSSMIVYSSYILEENAEDDFFGADLFQAYGIDLRARSAPNLILMNFVHSQAEGGDINWTTIRGIGNSGIVVSITLLVIAYCTIRIKREFKISNQLSYQSRKVHIHLFRALTVQFLVPFILCLLPYLAIIVIPLTGQRYGEIGNILANLVSIFPALDAFVVMYLVGWFRKTLTNWKNMVFGAPSPNTAPMSLSTRSTSGDGPRDVQR